MPSYASGRVVGFGDQPELTRRLRRPPITHLFIVLQKTQLTRGNENVDNEENNMEHKHTNRPGAHLPFKGELERDISCYNQILEHKTLMRFEPHHLSDKRQPSKSNHVLMI